MKALKPIAHNVIGLDVSTNSVAFCIMSDGVPAKWGEVKLSGTTVIERCGDAHRKMLAISKLFDYDYIVFEAAAYVNNRRVVIDLAYVFGAVVGTLMHDKCKATSVGALTWQNHIGNKVFSREEKAEQANRFPGRSSTWLKNEQRKIRKQRTIDWVESTYGISVISDNVADAFGIAFYGLSVVQ